MTEKTIRLKSLYSEIRCPVCEGQSLEDSEATLAQDLRSFLIHMVEANHTDTEIRTFLVQRYGDDILLRPQITWETAALWGFPVAVMALTAGVFLKKYALSLTSSSNVES